MSDDPYITALKQAYTESTREEVQADYESTRLLDRLAAVEAESKALREERDEARGVAADVLQCAPAPQEANAKWYRRAYELARRWSEDGYGK